MRNPEKREFYTELADPSTPNGPTRIRLSDGQFEIVIDRQATCMNRNKLMDLFDFYKETYGGPGALA